MRKNEFKSKLDDLNNYSPQAQKYIEAKNSLIKMQKTFMKAEKKLLKV